MTDGAYIKRSGDGSLRHRIDEYMSALTAYGRLEESQRATSRSGETDWLGDTQDLARAEKILKTSLAKTSGAIETQELKQAVEQRLISEAEAKKLSQTKLQMEFQGQSAKKQQSRSQSSGQKS